MHHVPLRYALLLISEPSRAYGLDGSLQITALRLKLNGEMSSYPSGHDSRAILSPVFHEILRQRPHVRREKERKLCHRS
jgi:hypothetical protein